MTVRRPVLVATVLTAALALTACSSKNSTANSSAAKVTAPSASSAPAVTSAASSTPAKSAAATEAASAVSGGGATDFCTAFKEYRTAVEADTMAAQGAGYRAAAADMRAFAPPEIKAAAGTYADLLDEVGKGLQAGRAAPELLGSGQSEQRRQALFDSSTWISKNCQP